VEFSIYVNREDARRVEADEKYNFIRGVLEVLEIPLEECFPEEEGVEYFTTDHKIKLRKALRKYDVHVKDDGDGGVKIYFEKEIIAEWKKPFFILKEDKSEVDKSKKLYIQIDLSYWTIFDGEIQESLNNE
jgi:hypothetical protein